MTTPLHTRLKHSLTRAYRGSTLILTAVVITMLISFLGVSVFLGLQAYLQSELQKAANTAVLVGASSLYVSQGNQLPQANVGRATGAAQTTWNAILANTPALGAFGAAVTAGPVVVGNSVTMSVRGQFPTPFLSWAQINQIQITARSRAQAVQYRPLSPPAGQPISITPSGSPVNPASTYASTVANIAIVDRTGNDLYVQQASESAYQIEACNSTACYNLGPVAKRVGGGSASVGADPDIIQGSVLIDLADAGVRKATSIKITDDGIYNTTRAGTTYFQTQPPSGTQINQISIYGYASLCPSAQACGSAPAGFATF